MPDCVCHKDDDGECLPCRARLQDCIKRITESQLRECIEFSLCEKELREICRGCGRKYLDYAGSQVIKGLGESDLAVKAGSGVVRDIVVRWGAQLKGRGVEAIPLTVKVWKNLCALHGWDPKL